MLYRKPKRGPVSDSDGATGAHRPSGLAPWSMAVDCTPVAWRKIQPSRGSRGIASLGCLPHWGREGFILAISTLLKNSRKFPMKIELFSMIRDFFEHSSTYDYCPAEESAPRRISNKQFKKTCPPCLGEALRRGSIVYITIFMVFGANTLFMPVSQSQIFFISSTRKPVGSSVVSDDMN